MAEVELPDASRRRPGLVIEISCGCNYTSIGFQLFAETLHAVRLQHYVVVKHQQVVTGRHFYRSDTLANGVWRLNMYSLQHPPGFLPFWIIDELSRFKVTAPIGNDDFIHLACLSGK